MTIVRNTTKYRGHNADIIVQEYKELHFGWMWRVLYKYDFQQEFTIFKYALKNRPTKARISQIISNI